MKIRRFRKTSALLPLALTVLLSACGHLPQLSDFRWPQKEPPPQYKPLGDELAALAAPQGATAMTVYCRAGRGSAHFGRVWHDFQDTDFILPENQKQNVVLHPKKGAGDMKFQAVFDRAGQKMVFCPFLAVEKDEAIACLSLYALDDDLAMGIKRTFDIPEAVMGASITCSSKPEKLLKL